ncbi:hypothetical protein D477_014386 [Arthrobacter crystallopoietes BAB-32]|uniref:Uncharacterized protein n=1 Tax=Arthrobacter crystallopoietes BAB-32 TaxID=1246476 RepID=N1V0I0_9MICC|nr:hypothetical protein [Arthrobacter crystallopoietes]EMY33549.1 hypothetical protein D477_014386 [Arthrobacter crystallopoietes BAB-32]
MSNNRAPRRDDTGIPRIDWRGTLWAMAFVFLLSYVFIALFPGLHPILRIVLVLALYFAGRYAYYRYVKKRR